MQDIKNAISTEIWLLYFNKYLFEKGVISEKEKLKMDDRIYQITNSEKRLDLQKEIKYNESKKA